MTGSESSNVPNLAEVFSNTLKKVQEQTKTPDDPKNAELLKGDIEFQLEKIRAMEGQGQNWKIVRAAMREEAEKRGIPPEVIFSWVYGPSIERNMDNILAIAQKHNKTQVFDLLTDRSLFASKDARDIASSINVIIDRLGHGWNTPDQKAYGPIGDVNGVGDGSLAAGVRKLQGILQLETDGMAGTATLDKLKTTFLASQESIKSKIGEEEKNEFEQIIMRHIVALNKLGSFMPANFSVEDAGLDLIALGQYAGHTIRREQPGGKVTEEKYDPNKILEAKDSTYFAPFGSSNEIWEAETKILEEAARTYEKFQALDSQRFPDKLEQGVAIYDNAVSDKMPTAQKIAEKQVKQMIPEAFEAIDAGLSWQKRLDAARGLWNKTQRYRSLEKMALEKLGEIVTEALQVENHDKIHWEEVNYYLPGIKGVTAAINTAREAVINIPKESLSKGKETIWQGSFENEIKYLLNGINPKDPATEQLRQISDIYERSTIRTAAQQVAIDFLNRKEIAALVKKAFKEIRMEKGTALEKLQTLRTMSDAVRADTKTAAAFLDIYNGKGNIDRELYGERGLVGQAFAELVRQEASEAEKLEKGNAILETLPTTSVAYAHAHMRFRELPGAKGFTVAEPVVKISGTSFPQDVWREVKEAKVVQRTREAIKTGTGNALDKLRAKLQRNEGTETEGQKIENFERTEIMSIRVENEEKTLVAVNLPKEVNVPVKMIRVPGGNYVVEFSGAPLPLEDINAPQGYVKSIRVEQWQKGNSPFTRLVIEPVALPPVQVKLERPSSGILQIVITPEALRNLRRADAGPGAETARPQSRGQVPEFFNTAEKRAVYNKIGTIGRSFNTFAATAKALSKEPNEEKRRNLQEQKFAILQEIAVCQKMIDALPAATKTAVLEYALTSRTRGKTTIKEFLQEIVSALKVMN